MNPRYPIFIPSKGRWGNPQTARRLAEMGVPFRLVVEPQEYAAYRAALPNAQILELPFGNLGQGSIPARNWIWHQAQTEGYARHWVLDDNIRAFYRLNYNRRIPVGDGTIFRCAEDFVDRYENVAIAGFNYTTFVQERSANEIPFALNERVYSMLLIQTNIPYQWRGRYNEDTDLCLRVMRDGWCTVLFNAFLGAKHQTLKMAGGNTDTIYNDGDHRLAFAQELANNHPDVARVVWKFNRWHHQVDYSPFRNNKLRLKPGVVPTGAPNEYGMKLVRSRSNYDAESEATDAA